MFPDIKPHQCLGDWVEEVWKIGGGTVAEIVIDGSNTSRDTVVANIVHNCNRKGAKWLELADAHDGHAVIIAGGPSLKDNLLTIQHMQSRGAKLFALNNVPAFLATHGIKPDAHVLLDALPSILAFAQAFQGGERYYSSQCDPAVLDHAGDELIMWNSYIEGLLDIVSDAKDPFIGGGTTVGTRSMGLLHVLGYRKIHIFGMDSCFQDGASHCYDQGEYATSINVRFDGKDYKSPPQLLAQVEEFKLTARQLMAFGCEIYVHGEGLLQAVARDMARNAA